MTCLVPKVFKVEPIVGVNLERGLKWKQEHEDNFEHAVDREGRLEDVRGCLLTVHLYNDYASKEENTQGSKLRFIDGEHWMR